MDFGSLLIIAFGAGVAFLICLRLDRVEARYAMLAFAFHVVGALGQWALHTFYYGYSDSGSYVEEGASLAKLLDYDFPRFAPELIRLLLHLDSDIPVELFGQGSGSGTMAAIAGFGVFLVGPSLLALSLLTSFFSWFGQLCWYAVAKDELEPGDRTAALLGLMLVPSVVFWGAAFAKEAIVLGAFGILGISTHRVLRRRRFGYVPLALLGGLAIALLKPYTLLPFLLAVGAFLYADRAWSRTGKIQIRPLYLLLAGGISLGGVLAYGLAFPQYSANNIVETVSHQQQAWDLSDAGSNVERVGGDATTATDELQLAPIALVNSFLRPFVFEAHGAPALGAAIENALFGLITLALLTRGRAAVRALMGSPFLVASTVFALVFGFAVGLTTSNLGSLSRYRVPMVPFYATTLLVLRARVRPRSPVRRASPRTLARSPHTSTA